MILEIVANNTFQIKTLPKIMVLIADFKTIILYSNNSILFVKYGFSTKI